MKHLPFRSLLTATCGLLFLSVTPLVSQTTVMCWNIRLNTASDGINAWPNRQEHLIAFIRQTDPDIIGLQEVLQSQMDDLVKGLPGYGWFGVGREDGVRLGEYVPVFYRTDRYTRLDGGHFWLSGEPWKAGKPAWDAACTRMVTWVKLAGSSSRDTLVVFNTHFDHVGVQARRNSATLLARKADSIAKGQPVVIMGDFNSNTRDYPYQVITGAGFADSRKAGTAKPTGPEYTFTGFDIKGKPGERIDYIFIRNTRPVTSYQVREDSFQGNYLSDHLPIILHLSPHPLPN